MLFILALVLSAALLALCEFALGVH